MGGLGYGAHVNLWIELWGQWAQLGDSVSVQWVPSRVHVQGNDRADEEEVRGSVLTSKERQRGQGYLARVGARGNE